MSRAVVNTIHQLRFEDLAVLLPRLRPFNDYHHEVRRQFTRWALSQSVEFGSWQAAWNRWTGAGTNTPGSVSFYMKCVKCHGKRFSLQYGRMGACMDCRGQGQSLVRAAALYVPAPTRKES